MEGRQVGHVAVDLDSGGLGSRDGLQFYKVDPEKRSDGNVVKKDHVFVFHFESANARIAAALQCGQEELVGCLPNDCFEDC